MKTERVSTDDLKVGDHVIMNGGKEWVVQAINHGEVTVVNSLGTVGRGSLARWTRVVNGGAGARLHAVVTRDDEARPGGSALVPEEQARALAQWTRVSPPRKPGEGSYTTQEYLLFYGMDPNQLQTASGPFGKAVAKLYRERYGKDAVFDKYREWVEWLGGEYDSNLYQSKDVDLLDAVREVRHPSLKLVTEDEAIRFIRDGGFDVEVLASYPAGMTEAEPVWLVEQQMKRCAMTELPCGHELCQQRRVSALQRRRRSEMAARSEAEGADMF